MSSPLVTGVVRTSDGNSFIKIDELEYLKEDLPKELQTKHKESWDKTSLRLAILALAEELVWESVYAVKDHEGVIGRLVNADISINGLGMTMKASVDIPTNITDDNLPKIIARTSVGVQAHLAQSFGYIYQGLADE